VNSYPEEKRAYPQRSVASQVIGFAGTDNKGLGGLEVEYNRNLTGKTGKQTIVRDPFGRAIDVLSMTPEQQGHDLFTTIDQHDRGERRGSCSADDLALAREVRDCRGARSAHRSRARDGAGAWLRRKQCEQGAVRIAAATVRSPTPTSQGRRSSS